MKKLLILAAALIVTGGAYAIAAGGEKCADGASAAHASCCAGQKAAKTAEGGAACCLKSSAAAQTAACPAAHDHAKEVVLAGKIVCEHCDLHTAKACVPALMAEGREGALRICSASKDIPALRQAGEVQVKGYLHPGPDGREEIEVISFNRKPAKT